MVFIVVDGREKMSKSMAEYFEKELKIFDTSMLLSEHRNNEVTCHLFEKTIDLPKHSSQRECVAMGVMRRRRGAGKRGRRAVCMCGH
jgi:hypothetical protein